MIRNRDELIYSLCAAAEIEHALLCQYLFAAFSLKTHPSEGGVDWAQLELAREWKASILLIARQEMVHLGYACNLLAAIGAGPHFARPNFPMSSRLYHLDPPIAMELIPFSDGFLKNSMTFERPTHLPSDPEAPRHLDVTIGELYGKIRAAFETFDEETLFIGPQPAQITTETLGFAEGAYAMKVMQVSDRKNAIMAIEQVIEEGEGTPVEHDDTHYQRLARIREDFKEERERCRAAGIAFDPVRPVIKNPVPWDTGFEDGTYIANAKTREVADLFLLGYETMLQFLLRFYMHTDNTPEENSAYQQAAFWPLMTLFIRPLGEILMQLPATDDPNGPTAGPSFHLTRSMHALPSRDARLLIHAERLRRLATDCANLRYLKDPTGDSRVIRRLNFLRENLERVSMNFESMVDRR